MRQPKIQDFDNGDGTYDFEEFEDVQGTYEDTAYDEMRDREMEEETTDED